MLLHQFRSFVAVAKHLSLSKASRELHVSQPSISHHLKSLEEEFRTRFYVRKTKGIQLTEAGQLLLEKVKPIVEQSDDLEKFFANGAIRDRPSREFLKIGGSHAPSTIVLPALIARFQRLHPNAQIELRTRHPRRIESLVKSSSVEIAVTTHVVRTPELICEPFRRENVVLFVAPGHRLARRRRVTVDELIEEPLILRGAIGGSDTSSGILKNLRQQGLQFKIGARFDVPFAVKAAVKQKMGVGLSFLDSIRRDVETGEFKVLTGHGLKLEGHTYITYRKDKPLSRLAQEFLVLLRRARLKGHLSQTSNTL